MCLGLVSYLDNYRSDIDTIMVVMLSHVSRTSWWPCIVLC